MSATYSDRINGIETSAAIKAPVAAATIANVTLSGLQTVDSVSLSAGDRVLVKDQTDATENGIWVAASGTWSRATDFNGARDIVRGSLVAVNSGNYNGGVIFTVTTDAPDIGASSVEFMVFAANTDIIDALNRDVETFSEIASVTAAMVDVGGLLRCVELGEVYERAADAATDADLDYSGSGGVKWNAVLNGEAISVLHTGAVSGAADNTADFQAALDAAPSVDANPAQSPGLVKPKIRVVAVPEGAWTITSKVTCRDDIVWLVSPNAVITGSQYLDGTINRNGRLVGSKHYGYLDGASTMILKAGRSDSDDIGGVYGITDYQDQGRVGPAHSVTLQIDNDTGITPPELTGTTFTTTDVTWTNSPDVSGVKLGSTVTVFKSGGGTYSGVVTAINEGTKTITTSGWYDFTGTNGGTPVAPTNGLTARVDYFGKIWGQNTNVFLRSGHPTQKAAGYEMGVLNYQSDSPAFVPGATGAPAVWGYDTINLATYKSTVGFIARTGATAPFRDGFISYGNEKGFRVAEHTTYKATVGFSYEQNSGTAFRSLYNGQVSFSVSAAGTMELGRLDAAATTYLDMHSSGNVNDYDARIQVAGGSATAGQGAMTILAGILNMPAQIGATLPAADPGIAGRFYRDASGFVKVSL